MVHCYNSFHHVNSNRDPVNTAQRTHPLKSNEDFTIDLDFLNYRPSLDHERMLKFLVSHGIRIFIIFVELNFCKKEVQWRDKCDVCRGCA